MSLERRVDTDRQLARLLQIGIVLEELVEARAHQHFASLSAPEREALDPAIAELLEEAADESAEHRRRLEDLIDALEADCPPYEEIETLVDAQYGRTKPEDFDGILYDQLHGEETAYKFYDDLIKAIRRSDARFGIDRDRVLATLRAIREEEAEGVREVTELMEERP